MKTFLRRALLTLVSLGLLLALFHLEENVRGHRAWSRWRAPRQAAGLYDRNALLPPMIPDAENFAAEPTVAGAVKGTPGSPGSWTLPAPFINPPLAGVWGIGRTADYAAWKAELKGADLETFLKPFDASLAVWTEAARRPGCRLGVNYQNLDDIPSLLGMRAMSRVLRVRALARLQAHHPDAALEDVSSGLRMVRHFQGEPYLISQLLRLAWTGIYLQPIWEGLDAHVWNDAQLARLEAELAPIDLLASMRKAWQFERCGSAEYWGGAPGAFLQSIFLEGDPTVPARSRMARLTVNLLVPSGWAYQNLRTMDEAYEGLAPVLDPGAHRVHADLQKKVLDGLALERRTPFNRLARLVMPAFSMQNVRTAYAQTGLDLARVACGLERYRLAHHAYPTDLQALVPACLPALPHEITTGAPLHYALKGNSFQLYAVGWSGTDGGGVVAHLKEDGSQDRATGDWVWFAEPRLGK